jgi:hypothetical protein
LLPWRVEGGNDCFGQLPFIDPVAVHAGSPQHGSTTFKQGDETDLGKGAGDSTGTWPAQGFFVFGGIGHIHCASILARVLVGVAKERPLPHAGLAVGLRDALVAGGVGLGGGVGGVWGWRAV